MNFNPYTFFYMNFILKKYGFSNSPNSLNYLKKIIHKKKNKGIIKKKSYYLFVKNYHFFGIILFLT